MYKVQQNEAKAYENSANIWIINMGGGEHSSVPIGKVQTKAR